MKILQIHNEYNFKGGEDKVVNAERQLLIKNGHFVSQIIRKNNDEIKNIYDMTKVFLNLSFSKKSVKILDNYFRINGMPDIVHIHNIFPLWTYSVFDYFYKRKIPMVMTLHNFRLLWENVSIFNIKDSLKYGLFKNSYLKTLIVSKLINKNRNLLSYVNKFIVLNEFAKRKFISFGIPENKIAIKQNFIEDDIVNNYKKNLTKSKNFICTSRLSKDKGIHTLLKAWKNLNLNLILIGSGPMMLNKNQNKFIKFCGIQDYNFIQNQMKDCLALILPSEVYEGGLPLSILEAYKNEVLVIASNLGSMKYEIKDKINGILFDPGNSEDLKKKIKWVINNKNKCQEIIKNSKLEFNLKYTSQKNYELIKKIYTDLLDS